MKKEIKIGDLVYDNSKGIFYLALSEIKMFYGAISTASKYREIVHGFVVHAVSTKANKFLQDACGNVIPIWIPKDKKQIKIINEKC